MLVADEESNDHWDKCKSSDIERRFKKFMEIAYLVHRLHFSYKSQLDFLLVLTMNTSLKIEVYCLGP